MYLMWVSQYGVSYSDKLYSWYIDYRIVVKECKLCDGPGHIDDEAVKKEGWKSM